MASFEFINPGDNPNEGRNKINYNFSLITMSGGTEFGNFLPLSGGTVSGTTNFNNAAIIQSGGTDLYDIFSISSSNDNFLPLSGGTVSGATVISGVSNNHYIEFAVNAPFAQNNITGISLTYRNITGSNESVSIFAGDLAGFDYVGGIIVQSSAGTTSFGSSITGSGFQFADPNNFGGQVNVDQSLTEMQYSLSATQHSLKITSGGCEWEYSGNSIIKFPTAAGQNGQALFVDGSQNSYFGNVKTYYSTGITLHESDIRAMTATPYTFINSVPGKTIYINTSTCYFSLGNGLTYGYGPSPTQASINIFCTTNYSDPTQNYSDNINIALLSGSTLMSGNTNIIYALSNINDNGYEYETPTIGFVDYAPLGGDLSGNCDVFLYLEYWLV